LFPFRRRRMRKHNALGKVVGFELHRRFQSHRRAIETTILLDEKMRRRYCESIDCINKRMS
jgi:hypothetical protein